MKTTAFLIILLCSFGLRAQVSVAYLPLTEPHPERKDVQRAAFDRVVVIDNRFDTVRLRMVQDATYPMKVQEFDGPASRVIAEYLEGAVRGHSGGTKVLYLDLRQFRFGNCYRMVPGMPPRFQIRNILFIDADAYLAGDGTGLHNICSFRKPVPLTLYDPGHLAITMATGLNELLHAIVTAVPPGDSVVQPGDLRHNVMEKWSKYPVNKIDSVGPDGIYRSFEDFLADKVTPATFSLKPSPDSIFALDWAGFHFGMRTGI
ncbi:MAG TPA: hypothetical protein VKR41_03350, partial [Puia sp.]|nr:hypothetical protein [Puia sp.]